MSRDDAKRSARKVWGATPAGSAHAVGLQVGSLEFFHAVMEERFGREMAWLLSDAPFTQSSGRRVLELGCGAGYDAYQFCRQGAQYVGIDLTPQNPARVSEHLAAMRVTTSLAVADAERLPFSSDVFDIVYSNGVLHHTPDRLAAFREALRTSRPGGTFWVCLYHRNSAFYWLTLFFWEHLLRRGYRQMSMAERLARIELTASDALPHVEVVSRRQLRSELRTAGFEVERVFVRKLLPEDLPRLPRFGYQLYERLPRLLEFLSRVIGWYVIGIARTPG